MVWLGQVSVELSLQAYAGQGEAEAGVETSWALQEEAAALWRMMVGGYYDSSGSGLVALLPADRIVHIPTKYLRPDVLSPHNSH